MKYKLKVKARRFFPEMSKDVEKIEFWKKNVIPIQLLDEVDLVYIEYGQKACSGEKRALEGWSLTPLKAQFTFTLKVMDVEYNDYNKINIPELMDKIQIVVNRFFKKAIY